MKTSVRGVDEGKRGIPNLLLRDPLGMKFKEEGARGVTQEVLKVDLEPEDERRPPAQLNLK